MSGSTVKVPELSKLRLLPPKSDTFTPLNATTDSGKVLKFVAKLPQTVRRTENPVLSTRVTNGSKVESDLRNTVLIFSLQRFIVLLKSELVVIVKIRKLLFSDLHSTWT
ncbi:hypothetical protein TMatcc_003678 [Talaromyces marneffei ATCC 18224]